jgi:hypothetical protein
MADTQRVAGLELWHSVAFFLLMFPIVGYMRYAFWSPPNRVYENWGTMIDLSRSSFETMWKFLLTGKELQYPDDAYFEMVSMLFDLIRSSYLILTFHQITNQGTKEQGEVRKP